MALFTAIPANGMGMLPRHAFSKAIRVGPGPFPGELGAGDGIGGRLSAGTLVWCVFTSSAPTPAATTSGIAIAARIFGHMLLTPRPGMVKSLPGLPWVLRAPALLTRARARVLQVPDPGHLSPGPHSCRELVLHAA